jgi:hypothetical protein
MFADEIKLAAIKAESDVDNLSDDQAKEAVEQVQGWFPPLWSEVNNISEAKAWKTSHGDPATWNIEIFTIASDAYQAVNQLTFFGDRCKDDQITITGSHRALLMDIVKYSFVKP